MAQDFGNRYVYQTQKVSRCNLTSNNKLLRFRAVIRNACDRLEAIAKYDRKRATELTLAERPERIYVLDATVYR